MTSYVLEPAIRCSLLALCFEVRVSGNAIILWGRNVRQESEPAGKNSPASADTAQRWKEAAHKYPVVESIFYREERILSAHLREAVTQSQQHQRVPRPRTHA